ncbi:ABC-type transporter, permease component [Corynebacterium kutscheri]|uniref:ABC-type transporter, permease component n=1 Tax=Corynebacterium kutscheri TaxID=35755 RepID=A0AB38VUN1_9CORY|nr:iron chelate uptake ABC transporter family permease subunit [Corynebacterium kutscheri]VEH08869.1 ABC-type transporter, permease component [Corynebacterium kutscheri]VEH79998.1 ABC-type transporter, permease component [Corynebacterium kutscheri]
MIVLCGCIIGSFIFGSSNISFADVVHNLRYPDDSHDSYIINELRKTRTIIGLLVGFSLATAGAVMQAITRNSLADPGLLGVNSGASLAIVIGMLMGVGTSITSQVFLAFIGALCASIMVYVIGTLGYTDASPVRLILAGIAFSTTSGGIIGAVLIMNPHVFDAFRFWDVGALTRVDISLSALSIPIIIGTVIIAFIFPALSTLALGDDIAASLGTRVVLTRTLALIALTLLCATATAAAGPISFVGLMIPYCARVLMGESYGWIIISCALLGPILVLSADILGRVIIRPAEMQVGLLTAFVGAPVLLYLVITMKRETK